jgi:methyl-accepting chemotaxis protein
MGFISGVIHKAKSAISDAGNDAKHTIHSVTHASKNLLHKTSSFIQQLDKTMLDIQEFANSVPFFEEMMNTKLPYVNASANEIIDASHQSLKQCNHTVNIIEAGVGEIDNILDDDPKLKRQARNFAKKWIQEKPKIIQADLDYTNRDISERKYAQKLLRFKPIMEQGKALAKQIHKYA